MTFGAEWERITVFSSNHRLTLLTMQQPADPSLMPELVYNAALWDASPSVVNNRSVFLWQLTRHRSH